MKHFFSLLFTGHPYLAVRSTWTSVDKLDYEHMVRQKPVFVCITATMGVSEKLLIKGAKHLRKNLVMAPFEDTSWNEPWIDMPDDKDIVKYLLGHRHMLVACVSSKFLDKLGLDYHVNDTTTFRHLGYVVNWMTSDAPLDRLKESLNDEYLESMKRHGWVDLTCSNCQDEDMTYESSELCCENCGIETQLGQKAPKDIYDLQMEIDRLDDLDVELGKPCAASKPSTIGDLIKQSMASEKPEPAETSSFEDTERAEDAG